jgi:DNA-binding XRE family transcriptional regulator
MRHPQRGYVASDYDTRIDAFRRRQGLAVETWADTAGLTRNTLYRIRSGAHAPRCATLALLVRAASVLLHRSVKASELYDLGEDLPVAAQRVPMAATLPTQVRRQATRFDTLLAKYDITPQHLASASGVSRQTLMKIRYGLVDPSVSTVASIVETLRLHGYPIVAFDLVDVGE